MSHKSKSHKSGKSHKLSTSEKLEALKVVCPHCGVWNNKECIHTTGRKRGDVCSPHKERLELANVDLSSDTKRKIKEVEDAEPETHESKRNKKKDKLTPEQRHVIDMLMEKVENLGKHVEFVEPVTVGPLISTYRLQPLHKTKVAHLESMMKDFALAVKAETLVVKRMPGEGCVGIFVPNAVRQDVFLSDTLKNVPTFMQKPTRDGHKPIPLNFGIDSQGHPFVDDLTMQPHMIVAGSTDSGKSTCVGGLLLSMCLFLPPKELKLIISDTKRVDFEPYYRNLPHLARPIAKDIYETMQALAYVVREMEARLTELSRGDHPTRNIHEYNKQNPDKPMPYIVVYIDELADIIGDQINKDDSKVCTQKLGSIVQRSRAVGIYVIASTQRPSVNVVKGSIKANFPSRVAFRLPSVTDSKTVLQGAKGAECLMSRGDMFYSSSTRTELLRLHAPYTELSVVKQLIEQIIKKEELVKQQVAEETSERIALQQEGEGRHVDEISTLHRKVN
jgi:DNA segregation ATPase FtsK/SpoIIIE, S-DNA-T family